MDSGQRRRRKRELIRLHADGSPRLLALYRRAVGLNRYSTLPASIDVSSQVESILDFEAEQGRLVEHSISAAAERNDVLPFIFNMAKRPFTHLGRAAAAIAGLVFTLPSS